jgi:hypothetical protein
MSHSRSQSTASAADIARNDSGTVERSARQSPGDAQLGAHRDAVSSDYEWRRSGPTTLHNSRRLTVDGPALVSRSGSLHYADAIEVNGRQYWYYEYGRSGGTHELRLSVVKLSRTRSAVYSRAAEVPFRDALSLVNLRAWVPKNLGAR